MPVIPGVVTEDARKYWPQFFGNLLSSWDPIFTHFKVGEGGWIDPGTGAEPRTPVDDLRRLTSPLIQDIDLIVDSTRAAIDQRYPHPGGGYVGYYQKALTGGDLVFETPSTIRVRCLLDFAEFNDDGAGNYPEIWEIGIFSEHPTEAGEKLMVAYGTFPMQVKDNTKQLENLVRITF
jgi:hypothetical protein